jgi:glutamine synthetase type III
VEANVASDHDQVVMETMNRVARRHQLALLLHVLEAGGLAAAAAGLPDEGTSPAVPFPDGAPH